MSRLPALPQDWRKSFERHLQGLQARMGVPGIGVTLFTQDEVLLASGYGFRDREAALPVTEDTIFGVASITKSFTALAVLKLVTDGALSLDDPVGSHLPIRLWDHSEPARIRHLLSHTSGLPPLATMTWVRAPSQLGDPVTGAWAEAEVDKQPPDVRTPERLIAWIDGNVQLLAKPGELFSYSNDGYCLLGALVERVSGTPFDTFVEEHVLQPLSMTRTTFDHERVLADPDHSTLYAPRAIVEASAEPSTAAAAAGVDAVLRSPRWETTAGLLGGGMLKSTLADLRSYVRYLMAPTRADGPDIEPSLVRSMARGYTWSGPGMRYGYGLSTREDYEGLTLVGHDGGLKGVSSRMGWVPEFELGGVVLCNLADVPAGDIWLSGINALTGIPTDRRAYAPGVHQATDAEVAPLLGSYASGEPYGRLRIYRDDAGSLRATVGLPPEDVPARMVAPDELALRFPEREAPVTAVRSANGDVRGVNYGSRVLLRVRSE